MGKNTNITKKGKQKAPTSAAPVSALPPPSPPPVVSSPPAAHHIPYPPAAVDTIEKQEEFGYLSGSPVEGGEESSWQEVDRPVDGWAADTAPENSNGDMGDSGWESGVTQVHMPPQPPQKQSNGGRDRTRSHYPQQHLQVASSNQQNAMGFGANTTGAHKSPAANWGYAKPEQQATWIPENDEWADQGESENDGWEANDRWNAADSGWDQQSHSVAWAHAVSAHSAHSQSTSHAPTSGWQSWGEEARRLPKVTFDPAIPPSPLSTEDKPVFSQQQRSQILNALLNNPQQNQQPYPMPPNAEGSFPPTVANHWQQHPSTQHGNRHHQQQREPHHSYVQHHGNESQNKKNKPFRPDHRVHQSKSDGQPEEEVHDVWGLGDGWSDEQDEEDQQHATQDTWGRRVHFSPSALRASILPPSAPSVAPSAVVENFTVNALPQNKLGLSTIPMSKTLSYAYSGTTPSTESEPGRAAMQRITDFHFVESRGEALKGVQRAFYGKQRRASDRFHWLFSPDKDERVSSLLSWINSMSFGIASFGLQKFLQTRERGALIVNAAYRPVHPPSEPAFDWISWNQIQLTTDRILQESVGYYNPAMFIIVFIFLPSPSGNSVAIWRRKIPIPNNIRLAYQAQITQAMASLRKEYPVFVDEYVRGQGKRIDSDDIPRLPPPSEPVPPPPPKKKRKWYKLWLSS